MYIYDGRDSFYQWDLNQKIADRNFEVGEEVHVFSLAYPEAMIVKAYSYNGEIVIDVPNILLQKSYSIFIYRCEEDNGVFCTYAKYEFIVNQRPKPPDYVYTETEVKKWQSLEDRIYKLEQNGTGSGGSSNYCGITYVENLDAENRTSLRSLNSGTYILHGYFNAYEGDKSVFTFSSGQLVSIIKTTSSSAIQIFYPPNNTIQYFVIKDDSYERQDAKLFYMEDIRNRVTSISETSDDTKYPSAKAVYDLFKSIGSSGDISCVEFETDETLSLIDGVLSVNRAQKVEQNNTLPITSAAVYTEVGNINALLQAL